MDVGGGAAAVVRTPEYAQLGRMGSRVENGGGIDVAVQHTLAMQCRQTIGEP